VNYSKGITWFDDCRIPADWKNERPESWFNSGKSKSGEPTYGGNLKTLTETTCGERLNDNGRFPANLLCSDDVLNDGSISKSGDNIWIGGKEKNWKGHTNKRIHTYNDKGSNSRYYDIDKWFEKMINEL